MDGTNQAMEAVEKDALLEDPISCEPFGSDPQAPNAPISLECGHTYSRRTIEDVRPCRVLCCAVPAHCLACHM
jgi:hypothetical protein